MYTMVVHVCRMSDLVLRFFTVLRFIPVVRYKLQTLPCTKLGHLSSVIIRVYICDIYLLVIVIVIFSTVVCGGAVVCVSCVPHRCACTSGTCVHTTFCSHLWFTYHYRYHYLHMSMYSHVQKLPCNTCTHSSYTCM